MYIDTAPKWPNRPRFRLKRTLVTSIVQEHFGEKLEQLPGKYTTYKSIDETCHELTEKYANKTIKIHLILKKNVLIKRLGKKLLLRCLVENQNRCNKSNYSENLE